jgi:hypothetical protein
MGSLWNRSGMIERQDDDIRAAGALAYFFEGLTTTPLTVFADAAEGTAHTNPVVADANGRWPDVFVPYIVGYDVQVKTSSGIQLSYTQNIPNPDPVDVSVIIPADNQVQTGMIHAEFVNTTRSGYVRLNGRTLGNAVSGATERANADTSALFAHLWNNVPDSISPVSGGRGGSAASDFAANKTIVLTDLRGLSLIGLDDMGNSPAGSFTGVSFNIGDAVTAASDVGTNTTTLITGNLPAHTHSGSTSTEGAHTHTGGATTGGVSVDHSHNTTVSLGGTTSGISAAHSHTYARSNADNRAVSATGANTTANSGTFTDNTGTDSVDHSHSFSASGAFQSGGQSSDHNHFVSFTTDGSGLHSHTFTTSSTGSGTPFGNVTRSKLVTWYIKL